MIRHVLRFNLLARFLHWTMAVLILAMLLIGLGMVSTVSPRYHELLSIHRSIGVVILVLAAVRLLNRVVNPPPPLPPDLPSWQTALAKLSYLLLYALMFSRWAGLCCPPRGIRSCYMDRCTYRLSCRTMFASTRYCDEHTPIWRCCYLLYLSRAWAPRCFTPSSAGTASCKAWSSEIIARLCRSRAGR
jgi:Prokaryotic cytochrome b561